MTLIRPISDLRNRANEISKLCHNADQPIFITKNGQGDLVVMSEAHYELQNKRRGVLILQIITFVIDITLERENDCSMGFSIDAIREFEQ